jgi:hypothetical protein
MQMKMAMAVVIAGMALVACDQGAAPAKDAAAVEPAKDAAAAPATAGAAACDKYQKCCDAVAKLPNMAALTQACAQIPQLKAAPGGDDACKQAMSAMAQGLSALPDGAPADCK